MDKAIAMSILRGIILLLFTVLLQACFPAKEQAIKNAPGSDLLWPGKPAKTRFAFVQAVYDAKDLGIEKSFFSRIVDLLFGGQEIALVKPMAVVVLQDGTLFIADPGVGGVHKFDLRREKHQVIKQVDGGMLSTPVGLAADADRVFVSDSSLGVFVIDPDASFARPFKLEQPPQQNTGIAFNGRTRELYVVDTKKHQIKLYAEDGKLKRVIGERGHGEGSFNFPTMLWMDKSENLYVTDTLNFRIQILSTQGDFIRAFGHAGMGTGLQSRPKGIATDRFGHIYIVDSLFHSVQVFSQQGKFLLNFGQQGNELGEFWLPTGIFIGGEDGNTIYVADSFNKRLQIFRYVGGDV